MKLQNKIGLGSVQFGLPYGISNKTGQTPIDEVSKILDFAFSNGIKLIDTASAYGTSEKIIGMINSNRFSIVSKFMTSESRSDINRQFKDSITLLKTECLYGYIAHRPLDLINNLDVWDELQKIKSENKIKKIGFSLNSPDEYVKLSAVGIEPDLVQVPFNYFDTRFKETLLELKAQGCEVHTRSTFLQGLFFSDIKKLSAFFDEVKPKLSDMQNVYLNQLEGALLTYVLKQEFIDVVIMGIENKEQLVKNMKSIERAPVLESLEVSYSEKILMPMHWPKD